MELGGSTTNVDNIEGAHAYLTCFFLSILCWLCLVGCDGSAEKETFKIAVVKDQFTYFNLTQFDADFNDQGEELVKVEESVLVLA